jgi:hypothetical protein
MSHNRCFPVAPKTWLTGNWSFGTSLTEVTRKRERMPFMSA